MRVSVEKKGLARKAPWGRPIPSISACRPLGTASGEDRGGGKTAQARCYHVSVQAMTLRVWRSFGEPVSSTHGPSVLLVWSGTPLGPFCGGQGGEGGHDGHF